MNRTLPLGIDIGTTRLRIVCTELNTTPRVCAVAARDVPNTSELLPSLIVETWDQLRTIERRCVLSVGMPHAQLSSATLKTEEGGRSRAAYAQARCRVDYPIGDAVVRWHAIDHNHDVYALGIVRAEALRAMLESFPATSLRVIAIDHDSLALQRALPQYDAVLDIGHARTSLHRFSGALPMTICLNAGSAQMTKQIQGDLGIDQRSAELRKRTYGVNGAGEAALDRLIAEIAAAVEAFERQSGQVQRVALVGNGARLVQLPVQLRRACGRHFELAVPVVFANAPDEGASADFALAAGLSTWSAAE